MPRQIERWPKGGLFLKLTPRATVVKFLGMARKLRLEYPGAGDQVMIRGVVADGKNKSI
jgi:hypothetical protein